MSIFATIVAVSALAQEKPAPPDRSGEPILKQIIGAMSGLKDAELHITTGTRSYKGQTYEADKSIILYVGGGARFQWILGSVWGDSGRFVSDGSTLMIDRMDEDRRVILKAAPANLASDPAIAELADPFVYLFAGEKALEKLVAKDGFVRKLDGAVQFKSPQRGTVTLFYDKDFRVSRVEFDNRDWLEEQHKKFPDWWDAPDDPMTVQAVTYRFGRLPVWAFDVRPPAGFAVQDERKKK
jgi:hypothetical protein